MISVCVATYNGEKYLIKQIKSILNQLSNNDELIICDDFSNDKTISIIKNFRDPRIKLYINKKNIGYVKNFEKLIELSNGEIILLSDQDDIWEANKISIIRNCFILNNDIEMLYHTFTRIDENDNMIYFSKNQQYSKRQIDTLFLLKQLFKPTIFGCTIAFRGSTKKYILPFPKPVYSHDHWLTVIFALRKSLFFLNEPLIKYRQHNFNLTPKSRNNIFKIIKFRLKFLNMIIYYKKNKM